MMAIDLMERAEESKHDAYLRGRADALKPIQKLLDDWFCDRVDDANWVLSQISIKIYEMTKEQSNG